MPKVTVIVPIYGVEQFIERCARSLFEQTLDDMEFIFVNDCTKDNSIAILQKVLKEYPFRESQTSIIHHEINKGLPSARLTGLRMAKGEYIAHCDSDDWVDNRMYDEMYKVALHEGGDIVVCDYNKTNGKDYNKINIGCHNTDVSTYIENCLYQVDSWSVWNKLVKKEKYIGITHPEYSMGEDLVVTIQLLTKCSKLCYCPKPFYNYFCNTSSITNSPTVERCERNFNHMKSNVRCLINSVNDYNFTEKAKDGFVYLEYNISCMLLPVIHKRKYYKEWCSYYKGFFKKLLSSKYISFNIKIKSIMTVFHLYPSRSIRID